MARFFLTSVIFALLTLFSASFANAAPALSQAEAKAAIENTRPGATFAWHSIQIDAPIPASVSEASRLAMPYPNTLYPVLAKFTSNVSGNHRDVTSNYYVFKDYSGHWHAETNAIPGNSESNPY